MEDKMPISGEIVLSKEEVKTAISEYLQKHKLYPDWAEGYNIVLLYDDGFQCTNLIDIVIKFVKSSK